MGTILESVIKPAIIIVGVGGFISMCGYFVAKAFYNAYTKSFKFFIRHKIMRKSYSHEIVLWCMDCMERGVGWYDAKKLLMVHSIPQKQINETLWVYDQMIIQLQGGKDTNGGKFKGVSGKIEVKAKSDLPTF